MKNLFKIIVNNKQFTNIYDIDLRGSGVCYKTPNDRIKWAEFEEDKVELFVKVRGKWEKIV